MDYIECEPYMNYGSWVIVICQCMFIGVNRCTTWVWNFDSEESEGMRYFEYGMSPKCPRVNGLVLSLHHYWELTEPLGGKAKWKVIGHWWYAHEGEYGILISSFSFFLILTERNMRSQRAPTPLLEKPVPNIPCR
jgi:hypothetical protein